MLKRLGSHSDSMLLALALWLCSLPLALFIVGPLLGWPTAGVVAGGLFIAALIVCWGVCSWKIFQDRSR